MVPIDRARQTAAYPRALREALASWLAVVVLVLAIFNETAWSLVQVWSSSATYGHGFLIVPICGYLVWRRRELLAESPARPSPWGLLAIAGAGLVWLTGYLVTVSLLQHIGLIVLIQATVLTMFGTAVTRVLLFPLAYLLLAVPFGDFAVAPLQSLTAVFAVDLLRLSDIPVYMENWRLVIPGGAFLVAEACAGVRYLLACIALGLLVCDLLLRAWWRRILFLALAVAVPIFANVIRAYGIILVAYITDFEVAVGVDHVVYGMVFLTFVTGILLAFAAWLRDRDLAEPVLAARPERGGSGGVTPSQRGANVVMLGIAMALVVALRGYGAWAITPPAADQVALQAPERVGAWQLTDEPAAWEGDFPGADAQKVWAFRKGERRISLFVAAYTHERPGAELVSAGNSLLGDPDAQVQARGRLDGAGAGYLPAPAYLIVSPPDMVEAYLVWYWYKVGDTFTNSGNLAKLHALKAKLLGKAAPAAVMALASKADEDAADFLESFAGQLDPPRLSRLLGQP